MRSAPSSAIALESSEGKDDRALETATLQYTSGEENVEGGSITESQSISHEGGDSSSPSGAIHPPSGGCSNGFPAFPPAVATSTPGDHSTHLWL
eukprot:CAMPEP_0194316968 /NCGR_PEP_ID=MMETSP0171-20130528/13720_1 /TAXON_ID=218684 /ORGANISM="Corethron pennatum, Strain L29A3" /LENGTH=93 /DNA_ID=CAMNT_0039073395 /DNA_START=471 /DNA_END=749 /DNA_ORIENTATION=-